jgi:hypothetical protein
LGSNLTLPKYLFGQPRVITRPGFEPTDDRKHFRLWLRRCGYSDLKPKTLLKKLGGKTRISLFRSIKPLQLGQHTQISSLTHAGVKSRKSNATQEKCANIGKMATYFASEAKI